MVSSLHIITTLDPGGAEKQLLELTRAMKRKGETVAVLYLKGTGTLVPFFLQCGIPTQKITELIKAIRLILDLNKRGRFIVHGHLPRAELLATLVSLLVRQPLCLSKHNTEPFYRDANKFVSNFLARIVNRHAKKIICISMQVKKFLIKSQEISNGSIDKLEVIYYGIRNETKVPNLSNNQRNNCAVFKLMTACRLVDQKNPEILIESVAEICSKGLEVQLDIFGEGHKLERLKEMCFSLGLPEEIIRFRGVTRNLEREFKFYDAFVLATYYEGFGLVALEAAANGLPVLVSRIPVMQEIWANEALFFNNDSPEELSSHLANLILYPDALEELRLKSCSRASRFNIDQTASKVLELYSEVIYL
jgi:glycosyltransferase involved in cell wall biosynthesis